MTSQEPRDRGGRTRWGSMTPDLGNGLTVKTFGHDVDGNAVHIGEYVISLASFVDAAIYVLTNTDLAPEDERRLFLSLVATMTEVPGYNWPANPDARRLRSTVVPDTASEISAALTKGMDCSSCGAKWTGPDEARRLVHADDCTYWEYLRTLSPKEKEGTTSFGFIFVDDYGGSLAQRLAPTKSQQDER